MATIAVATARETTSPCVANLASCTCPRGARMLHCFSLGRNWSRLTAIDTASTHLNILDGLRVVMVVWVILAHRYMLLLVSSATPRDLTQHAWDWRFWWVFNAYPAVDTFFFISAFLVSIYLKKRLHQFTFSSFYFQRYLRLVPAMGYVTWGCSSVLRHVASGPVWNRTYDAMFGRPCSHTAWTNMLLLNNFNDANHMCLGHLWSLAVEWQLYMVTPLLLLPAYRCPASRLRWLPLSACFTLSLLLPAALTLQYHLPPTPTFWDYTATKVYYNVYYIVPWCRAGPYLVGLGAGCLYLWLDHHHHRLLNLSWVRAWGWACVVVVAVLMGPSYLAGRGPYWAALYSSLARPAWACVLAVFVINAVKGTPGMVARLASRPMWAPLGRLSYSVFLVSLPLQTLIAAAPHKLHYHHLTAVYLVVGDVVMSGVAGLLLVLLVEAPAASLLPLLASGTLWRGAPLPGTTTKTMAEETTDLTTATQDGRWLRKRRT
ncbi:O-acyltransferase like protein isoform X2 [Procambarus clarkii]|uniref:O-acyltransferase like protein isoform X2 n=1 Tax=Procambarus clarkii TaxID=6728 RepID=UPI003742A2A8